MPSFGSTYGDAAVNRRTGGGGGAAAASSNNKSPLLHGSSYTASAVGGGGVHRRRSTSAATGGGFGYDGDEEGDLLPSHTTNDDYGGNYRYTTSSHGGEQQQQQLGGYDKTSATTPPPPSSSTAMMARLLASCTGIEFGAGPKQLEKYDRLSYDAEVRGGGGRGGVGAAVQPASESTYSSVLSEIVATPLTPTMLTQQLFYGSSHEQHGSHRNRQVQRSTHHYLQTLQSVLDDAITNAAAVPYFRDAIVKLTPSGINIFHNNGDSSSTSSFLAHTCEHSAQCLDQYAHEQTRQLHVSINRGSGSAAGSISDDAIESVRLSIGFAQLISGFLMRKVRETVCSTTTPSSSSRTIPWEVVKEVREEPLASTVDSGADSNAATALSLTALQTASPGRIVFTLNSDQDDSTTILADLLFEAVADATATSTSVRGRSSQQQRGAHTSSSITESILGNIKNVLKRMTTSQMLGCVLSGFVIDVQSKITSDGLLEGVRLMSAASVYERSRIACETSSHGYGVSTTPNVNGAAPHQLQQNGNNSNKSREEALRELRQHHHIDTSGAALGNGGPAGFYDPTPSSRGGVMGGTAIDDFSGVHALEQSMNTRAAQKQRQRAVEEEIQRIRDRELQMREDIRPVSVAGGSRSSHGSVAPDHHHERRHSHHHSQPPPTNNNSHFPSPNRGHAAVRASSTHSHTPSITNVGDHYQRHHNDDDTTMALPHQQPGASINRSEHNTNSNPVTSPYTGASPSPAPFHRNGSAHHSTTTTTDPYVLEQRIRQNLRDDALLRESSSRPTMSVPPHSSSSVAGVGEYEASLRGQSTTSNNMTTTLSSLKTQDMYGDVGSLLNQLEREEKAAERGIRMQRDRLHMPHHHHNTTSSPTPTTAPIQEDNHRRREDAAPTTPAVAVATTKREEPAVVVESAAIPSPQTPTKVNPTPLAAAASPAPTNPAAAATSTTTTPQSPLAATTTPANSGSTTTTNGGPSPAGWIAKKDPATGRMFYSNKALGKSTWKRIETDLPAEEDTPSSTPVMVTLETHSPGEGWKGVEDKSTGKTYFVNKALGKSSWKLAETNPVPKASSSSASSETATTTTATITAVQEAASPSSTATTVDVATTPIATPPAKSVPPPPPTKTAPPPPKKSVPPPPTSSTGGVKSAPAPHVEVSDKDNTQENERRRQEEENKKSENKSSIKTATGKSLADALREQQAKMEAEEKERGPRPIAVARGSGAGATQSSTTAEEAEKEPEAKPVETVAAAVAPEPQSPAKKGVPPPPPPKKSVPPPPPPKKSVPPPPPKKSVPAAPVVATPTPAEPAAVESATPSSPTTATETSTPSSQTTAAVDESASRGASPSGGGGGGGPGAGKIYGSYKEVYDPKSKRYYYRHLVTKVANWTMPPEVAALKKREEGAGGDEGGGAPTPASATPTAAASPPKIVVNASGNRTCGPWIEKEDPKSGRMYYANAETKGRTWKIQETSFAAHM